MSTDPNPGVPPASALRLSAFRDRADPLFFKWQVALATEASDAEERKEAWLAEREAIQFEFPYE